MQDGARWVARVEREMKRKDLTVGALCASLAISRPAWYEYRKHPDRHPLNEKVVQRIAQFLGEDATALASEMGMKGAPAPLEFLTAATARTFSTHMARRHIESLGQALGMTLPMGDPGTTFLATPVVLEQLIFERLAADGGDPVAILVVPLDRGRRHRHLYQYQVYCIPQSSMYGATHEAVRPARSVRSAEGSPAGATAGLESRILAALEGSGLPATIEHSRDLKLPDFADRSVCLILPHLLNMVPAPWIEHRSAKEQILVLGVYYSGATDIAGLLARELGMGLAVMDHLARMAVRATLASTPDRQMSAMTARIARSVLLDASPIGEGVAWAIDDVEAVLTLLRDNPETLAGNRRQVVMARLDDRALDYASFRMADADASYDQVQWRDRLASWQDELTEHVKKVEGHLTVDVALPSEIVPTQRRYERDEVDLMFDAYVDAATSIAPHLHRDRGGKRSGRPNPGRRK